MKLQNQAQQWCRTFNIAYSQESLQPGIRPKSRVDLKNENR